MWFWGEVSSEMDVILKDEDNLVSLRHAVPLNLQANGDGAANCGVIGGAHARGRRLTTPPQ